PKCLWIKIYLLCIYNLFLLQLGKSVIAKVTITKGTVLSLDMFAVKVGEPKGIPPENMQNLVGKKIKVDVEEDDSILADMIE
uniref:Ice-structuring protein n=1 Tax=Oreochromis niloticus TaxID=8128 RepID=A0A669EBT6_ORENI